MCTRIRSRIASFTQRVSYPKPMPLPILAGTHLRAALKAAMPSLRATLAALASLSPVSMVTATRSA